MKAPKPSFKARKIGQEVIYGQQWEVARDVRKVLQSGRRTPLLVLQFQSGKTGAITAIIHDFIQDCVAAKKTFQIVAVCGLPHLDLASQTRVRLNNGMTPDGTKPTGAELHALATNTGLIRYPNHLMEKGILVLHNSSSLKRLDLNMPAGSLHERLIVIDEIHAGNVRNGNIDSFLRNHGVLISEQPHFWEETNGTNTRLVGVSATPFAHSLLSEQFGGPGQVDLLFDSIYREPGETYTSVEAMLKNGRLKQVEAFFIKDRASAFLKSVDDGFKAACQKDGPGYLVIRATGQNHTRLLQYLSRKVRKPQVKMFDNVSDNIGELNNFLSRKPDEPMWVVIRGAMRAGMTLGDNYIRAWVETNSKQVDTQTQAGIGRACGYGRTERYPIYCDLQSAEQVVAYYQGLRNKALKTVPTGLQNHGVRSRTNRGVGTTPRILTYARALKESHALTRREEIKHPGSRPKKKTNNYQILSTKGNETNDIARVLVRGGPHARTTYGYRINGPHPSYGKSYAKLMKKHPRWKNVKDMVVVLQELGEGMPKEEMRDLHKSKSALRREPKRRAR